ncbi:MAG: HlyD family efflux transporter periplasmic adaptor subunit [Phycisphaerales bacterium]|nr:HlyD family efflux transporter periplasmic adaptor subunit [Phycisphaerales bacterium]
MSKPILVTAVIVLVGGLLAGWIFGWWSINSETDGTEMRAIYTVQRRDMTISVTQAGEIQARSYTDYVCEVEGRPSIVDVVREGTYISPEDVANKRVLIQLDTSELQEFHTKQKITFVVAEAEFTGAKETLAIQHNQNESDIQAALLAVKFARMDLAKYLSEELTDDLLKRAKDSPGQADQLLTKFVKGLIKEPDSPKWGGAALQAKRVLESKIKLAKGTHKRDDNRLRGTKRLHDKEYVAASELESDELARQRSEIDVQQAETAMSLFMRYDLPKEIERLFSDYQEAKRALDRTRASVRSKLAQAQAKLKSAQATYDLQKEQLDKLTTQLAACTIRATTPGMVIYSTSMNYEARERDPIEIGDIVHKGQKMLTIPNSSEVAGVVRVHESWIEKVHPDLPVRVTADPFPDSVFEGSVETVSPLPDAQSRWANTGLKVYTTYVSIKGRDHVLRPGMSAKMEIVIDELEDVLCVPLQAVANMNGAKMCYLVTPAGLEGRVVETGQYNDSFVEITGGLSEGDVVSLIPPRLNGVTDDKTDRQDEDDQKDKTKRKDKAPKKSTGTPAVKPAKAL